ncbi:MAG: glycine cleavage system protein H [Victivallaceae bacterium]
MFFYTKTHLALDCAANQITVHLSEYAVKMLGGIEFINLPEVGCAVHSGEVIFDFESAKMMMAVNSPCDGVITQINTLLENDLSIINRSPEGEGWVCRITLPEAINFTRNGWMSKDEYLQYIA